MKEQKKKPTAQKTQKVLCKKSTTIAISAQALTLQINQTFKFVKDIAAAFGANILPRHGFGYIGKNASTSDVAVWCVNIDKNPYWINQLVDKGSTLLERKLKGESRVEFVNRIRKNLDYDTDQLRLTFARIKGVFHFIGIFQLSGFDIDTQTTIFKKVKDQHLLISYKQTTKTLKVTIEETEESTEGLILI